MPVLSIPSAKPAGTLVSLPHGTEPVCRVPVKLISPKTLKSAPAVKLPTVPNEFIKRFPVFVCSSGPVLMGAGTLSPGGARVGGVNAKTAYPARSMPKARPRIVDFEKKSYTTPKENNFLSKIYIAR